MSTSFLDRVSLGGLGVNGWVGSFGVPTRGGTLGTGVRRPSKIREFTQGTDSTALPFLDF